MKATSIVLAHNHHEYTSHIRSPAFRKPPSNRQMDDDEDWIMQTPKRKQPRTFSEKKMAQSSSIVENDVNRIIQSVAEEACISQEIKSPVKIETQSTIKPIEATEAAKEIKGSTILTATNTKIDQFAHTRRSVTIKRDNEKKKQIQVSFVQI